MGKICRGEHQGIDGQLPFITQYKFDTTVES